MSSMPSSEAKLMYAVVGDEERVLEGRGGYVEGDSWSRTVYLRQITYGGETEALVGLKV